MTRVRPASVATEARAIAGRRPSYVWFFLAYLVANAFSKAPLDVLPVGPDRIFFAGAMALLVLDRRVRWRDLRARPVHLAATATLSVAILSAIAHQTLTTSLGFYALLDRLLIPYMVFALAPLIFFRAADRLLALKVLTCLGTYLGVIAVLEVVGPQALVFPRYIMDPDVGIGFGRARGPFTASEANGLTLIATGYAAIALMRSSPPLVWRRLSAVALPITLLGALLTLTRSIWLGMLVGFVVVGFTDPRLRKMIAKGAVLVTMLAAAILVTSDTVADKAFGRAAENRSLDDRRNTNAAALRAIEAHPLTGVGWMRFIEDGDQYVRQAPDYPITTTDIEIHNVVLSRTAELGIPGGAAWVVTAGLGLGLAAVRRPQGPGEATWRLVLLGSLSAWSVSVMTSPVPYPLPNTLVWLFAGLALSSYLKPRPPQANSAAQQPY